MIWWIGFGKVWTRKLVQTLSKAYLVGTRDRFSIGFERVFWSKVSQSLSNKPYLGRLVEYPPLDCLITSFRLLGFLLWFVLGPRGLREAPRDPGNAHGGLWGASRGPSGPGAKNLKTYTFCRALLSGRVPVRYTGHLSRTVGRDVRRGGPGSCKRLLG